MLSLPPNIKPDIIIIPPPKKRDIPVAFKISVFLDTILVSIPPNAEKAALRINIPSPPKEKAESCPEPIFTVMIPEIPRIQPTALFTVKCSSLNNMQDIAISIKVLSESITAEREPDKRESPI